MELWLTTSMAFDPLFLLAGILASSLIRERLLRMLAVPLWVCLFAVLVYAITMPFLHVGYWIASSLLSGLLVAGTFNVISLLRRDHKTS